MKRMLGRFADCGSSARADGSGSRTIKTRIEVVCNVCRMRGCIVWQLLVNLTRVYTGLASRRGSKAEVDVRWLRVIPTPINIRIAVRMSQRRAFTLMGSLSIDGELTMNRTGVNTG